MLRERIGRTALATPVELMMDAAHGVLHPTLLLSGATAEEEAGSLPGDDLVPEPTWTATRAETIHATPRRVWPWVAQMGWGRGGYYAYAPLDPHHANDLDEIAPHLQEPKPGDRWPDRPGAPEEAGGFTVSSVDPGHAIVLHSLREPLGGRELDPKHPGTRWMDCSWAFVLLPEGRSSTRLLVRTRIKLVPAWGLLPARLVLASADTVMQRTMLQGIRERAERPRRKAKEAA
jgi:proline iminopeptidase